MEFLSPGRMRSLEEFRARWRALDPEMDCDAPAGPGGGPLGRPIEVLGRRLENRFAVHPMEGWDATPDGAPSELTLRRWRRFGASGAALVFGGEAYAVQEDGRANPRQLFLNPAGDPERGLAALVASLRAGRAEAGAAGEPSLAGLQLTHSGRWAQPHAGRKSPRIPAHHPILDARVGLGPGDPILADGGLEAIAGNYARAARLAREAGFDFVDVKCCHGYLLHELLGARARPGRYGGDFAGRTRLFREIVAAVRAEAPGLDVAVRVSIADVIPFERDPETGRGRPAAWAAGRPYLSGFGVDASCPARFDFEEPLRFLGLLRELGIRLVNVSLGSPYYCPHLQRPAAYPPSDGYLPPEDPLLGVIAHLRAVRRCKAAFPDLVFVGTGYSYLQEWLPAVAAHEVGAGHADFAGLGRMVLSYPELPADVLAGRPLRTKAICRTFSECTTGPRQGLVSGCYPLDDAYRARPEAETMRALRKDRIR